jgi:hypothetical protein
MGNGEYPVAAFAREQISHALFLRIIAAPDKRTLPPIQRGQFATPLRILSASRRDVEISTFVLMRRPHWP